MNVASKPLAVFAPLIGRWGHQWLKAHMDGILPGRTVVVGICAYEPDGPCWDVDAPSLFVPPRLAPVFRNYPDGKTIVGRLPEEHRAVFWSDAHTAKIREFLIQHRVEAILTQWLDTSLPLMAMARDMGLRYYCQAHGTDISDGLTNPEVRRIYQAYNGIDAIVAPSEFGRQQLLQLGLDPGRTHVVRHAVTIPERPVSHAPGIVRCLAVGRMERMKGPVLVIDAFRRAAEIQPDLVLDYVGDGDTLPAVMQLLRAFDIEDRVTLHGFLSHERALEIMHGAHILIHPSVAANDRFDTCPVSVAEAMAHGLAIVASRHGGIPEQIVDGESGLLVDEYDTKTMGEHIATLARRPALRIHLGLGARVRAQEMFSAETVRTHWLRLLGLDRFAATAPFAQAGVHAAS